jgi:hypothetical protein
VRVHSQQAIADALGVTQPTIAADELQLQSTLELNPASRVRGKDGKVRPVKAKREPLTFITTLEITHRADSPQDAQRYADRAVARLVRGMGRRGVRSAQTHHHKRGKP